MTSRLLTALIFLLPALAQAAITCSFNSTPALAFGAYDDASAAPTNGATTIVARCFRIGGPANVSVVLQIGASANSGTIATRQLRSGANPMNYNLYRDAARTLVWGQSAGVDTMSVDLNGIPNSGSRDASFTVYGRIPALQNTPAGTYGDSVQMTISP